jgi:hypothetical protein
VDLWLNGKYLPKCWLKSWRPKNLRSQAWTDYQICPGKAKKFACKPKRYDILSYLGWLKWQHQKLQLQLTTTHLNV